ncbi:hypothetical protein Sfulv_46730 [Streptomyces fulvorobeus]|uniref:Uncharacterized protein n=1 Tax=Streptomyces fulvorobeus TaxID=284028 RepID=A0A7J0CBK1_9ACTN|nr:hypothetical protein Sfulv_46730 [Streptomyces fulvorobeus]
MNARAGGLSATSRPAVTSGRRTARCGAALPGPGHDGVQQGFLIVEGRQHQASEVRHARAQFAADIHTVAVWKPYVEHRHIRAQSGDSCQSLFRGPRLPYDADVGFVTEEITYTAPDHFVIVEKEDPDRILSTA